MKYAQHFLLALLVSGLMVIPGVAQTSSNSNQQSAEQSGNMPNPRSSNGKYTSGNTGAESNKESSDNFATGMKGGTMTDHQFIKKAAEDDLAEVQIAKLAEQKATDNNLKQMAEHFINDHQQNEKEIKQVAQQQGVTLPTQPDSKDKARYDRLSKLNGTQFDKAFAREQVKDHKKDVAIFKRESSNAKDQAVKQYASNTLPTLEQHLQMAESSAQQLGVQTTGGMHHHHKGQTSASNNQSQMK